MNVDETAVASVLKDYQTALNGSDTQAVLKLYAPDGVFMP
jgi:ketosteroid isomerase-like protein